MERANATCDTDCHGQIEVEKSDLVCKDCPFSTSINMMIDRLIKDESSTSRADIESSIREEACIGPDISASVGECGMRYTKLCLNPAIRQIADTNY